ncbi:MAG TPA: hypothetical protein VG738_10410 [Chitinophagaceae bacterium]|nr:hypothetical protein [Chitinophagaceae bacterium]
MHKFNLRVTAVFLLLVLTQSMGVRLMLHNKFHKTSHNSFSKSTSAYVQISCDCVDEALMPSTPAQAIEMVVPEQDFVILTKEHPYFLPAVVKVFHSLRAPPAA